MNKRINNNDDSEKVDIFENHILEIDKSILSIILFDRTTNKNILWCTDNYYQYGEKYLMDQEIKIELITGKNGDIIKPRTEKSIAEQKQRVKSKAEVFTPSWVCKEQNDLIDEAWQSENKTWQDYVVDIRMEITCGEAPYLVSRYDMITGQPIELPNRVGLLDRKLKKISEHCNDEKEWLDWTIKAYKSIYGYDWQGDNVLLARENLLYTFKDYYIEKFKKEPTIEYYKQIAEIISWNIWQMDGLKYVIPNSCQNIVDKYIQMTFFGEQTEVESVMCDGCKKNNCFKHNGIYCKIKDWETGKTIRFVDLLKGRNK